MPELPVLVVISIIVVLAAILLPALGNAKKRAHVALCVNNQKQLYMGAVSYGDDTDAGELPPGN